MVLASVSPVTESFTAGIGNVGKREALTKKEFLQVSAFFSKI